MVRHQKMGAYSKNNIEKFFFSSNKGKNKRIVNPN